MLLFEIRGGLSKMEVFNLTFESCKELLFMGRTRRWFPGSWDNSIFKGGRKLAYVMRNRKGNDMAILNIPVVRIF